MFFFFSFGISVFNGQLYADLRKIETNFLKYLKSLGPTVLLVSNVIQDLVI